MAVARITAALLAFCLALGAHAAGPKPPGAIPDDKLLGYIGKDPLPAGVVPWQLFRQVKINPKAVDGKSMLPEFSAALKALDGKAVKVYGFVLPLSTGAKQTHFLISPLPTHCPYCVDQGPDSMIEVVAKTPVEYNQWEPMVISGKLELVTDPYLYYRVTNGEPVKF